MISFDFVITTLRDQ